MNTTQPRLPLSRVLLPALIASLVAPATARADTKLPAIFGDHMVLQQQHRNPVWGWDNPGQQITATIAGQSHSARADADGGWKITLNPLPAGGPHELVVNGSSEAKYSDVMIGEVWLCSGQSNMQWPVNAANDPDLETRTANYPGIRLITVPQVGVQTPQNDFKGQWALCTPETVGDFSAVGYFFGRQLHQTLGVTIGLIDNSWGGSSAEAWVRRDLLEKDDRYNALMDRWKQTETTYDHDKALADYRKAVADYETKMEAWRKESDLAKRGPSPRRPRRPNNPLAGQHRPGNLYCGVLHPIIGYGIKGTIWYQGESNAGRAYQYRHLFPLMIQSWRDEWAEGDFPFYWVQLADYQDEKPEPSPSAWAELREAQTMTLSLPNTGEAVIIDLGEAHDIHPRNKQDVAKRLARWALNRDYSIDVVCQSPTYKSMERQGHKIVLTFDHVGGGLDTFDIREPIGFTVAGDDQTFHKANAQLRGSDKVEVWSDAVPEPVAARYAWADNPVCNLQNREGLPATPFRTDDWPGITANSQ